MILNFDDFRNARVNERALNEWGGDAGIDFTTSCRLEATYKVNKGGFSVTHLKVTPSQKFNARGGTDGMSDVGIWLLSINDERAKKGKGGIGLSDFMKIKASKELLGKLSEAEVEEQPEVQMASTIGDLFKMHTGLELTVDVDVMYHYDQIHFGGHVRGKFTAGEMVMADGAPEGTMKVNGAEIMDKKFLSLLSPTYNATKRFVDFYEEVFNEKGKDEHVEEELSYEITKGTKFDRVIEDMLKSKAFSGVSIKKFKAEYLKNAGYRMDIKERIPQADIDKLEKQWYNSLKDEYSQAADPGAEEN